MARLLPFDVPDQSVITAARREDALNRWKWEVQRRAEAARGRQEWAKGVLEEQGKTERAREAHSAEYQQVLAKNQLAQQDKVQELALKDVYGDLKEKRKLETWRAQQQDQEDQKRAEEEERRAALDKYLPADDYLRRLGLTGNLAELTLKVQLKDAHEKLEEKKLTREEKKETIDLGIKAVQTAAGAMEAPSAVENAAIGFAILGAFPQAFEVLQDYRKMTQQVPASWKEKRAQTVATFRANMLTTWSNPGALIRVVRNGKASVEPVNTCTDAEVKAALDRAEELAFGTTGAAATTALAPSGPPPLSPAAAAYLEKQR